MTTAEDLARWTAAAETGAGIIGEPEDSFFRRAQPFLADAIGEWFADIPTMLLLQARPA
ncbi:MAG TPA: hypothetical protein VFR99_08395 [Marmoricola sp.]|nr:hypothetical protein [Marmoricola sp.]